MGFDIGNPGTLDPADAIKGADLVMQQVFYFLCAAGHGTAAETDQVRVGRVRTDHHVPGQGQGHCLAHDARVAGMETAGDVGAVDVRHDLGIQAHGPVAETFTHIAIQ
ncbi:hypothetical protein D3C76_1032080 [compost metagenome]